MGMSTLKPRVLWGLAKESATAWSDDFAPSMGAAIAYYTVFSIAPLLVIAIAIAGLVFGQEAAQGQIFVQLRDLIGPRGATAIEGVVASASEPGRGIIATIAGIVTLILGASTVFGELQSDLNRIWKAPAPPKASGIWKFVRSRLLSFGLVLGVGFLLLVSLVLSAALSALGTLWDSTFGPWEWLLHAINFLVSFVVVTGLFAMIYKLLPRVEIGWHDVWIGAAVTALLFAIGKFLIGLYIGKSSVVSGFGAAGSLVVLLLWVYYSAQIFLLGAEFTWAYTHRYGSRRGTEPPKSSQVPPSPARQAPDRKTEAHSRGSTARSAATRAVQPALASSSPIGAPSQAPVVVPAREDAATRVARAADRHPAIAVAVAVGGFALAGFVKRALAHRGHKLAMR